MFKWFNKTDRGFTLIELLVVMIIIGILVLLATPRFIRYIELARYTRIVNDIRALETVVVPDMVRNNMQFPKGTDENFLPNLSKAAKEDKAYMKDGIIAKGTSKDTEEFKNDFVGKVSEVGAEDIETGFYKLDYKGYVKPETKTRLKGQFFINKDGDVVYVDGKEVGGIYKDSIEAGGEVDRTEVFRYKSDDPTSPDSGVIVGANVEHEYWDGLRTDETYKIEYIIQHIYISGNYYKAPQFPATRMIEGKLVPVIEIGSNAFNRMVGDKIHRDNTHMLKGEFKIGENTEIIGEAAYEYCIFEGDFKSRKIEVIGDKAFKESRFTGEFKNPLIKKVGNVAFKNCEYTGELEMVNAKIIGGSSFLKSKFEGEMKLPLVEYIGDLAFTNSKFTGTFQAPYIKDIGSTSFSESLFNGEFLAPNIEKIGHFAFNKSEYTGEFNAPRLKVVGLSAFAKSKFNEEFKVPLINKIFDESFMCSRFKGEFNAPNLQSVGNYAFTESIFEDSIDIPNIKDIGTCAFEKSSFTNINLGNIEDIVRIGKKNINSDSTSEYLGNTFTGTVVGDNFTEDNIKITGIDTEAILGVKKAIINNGYWDREYGYGV